MHRIRLSAVLSLSLLLAIASSALAQEGVAPRPTLSVGDKWQYQFKNTRSPSFLTRTQGCDYSVTVEQITNTTVYSRINFPEGCEVSITTSYPVAAGSLQKFDVDLNHFHHSKTPYKAFAFPLEVGKTWSADFRWSLNGWTYDDRVTGRVESIEKVTTPAGTFEAFKVSLRRTYRGTHATRSSQAGIVDDTFWYSPEVKNFVKRVYDDGQWAYIVRELVTYELH